MGQDCHPIGASSHDYVISKNLHPALPAGRELIARSGFGDEQTLRRSATEVPECMARPLAGVVGGNRMRGGDSVMP
jgi:hypothetical protein